MSALNPQWLSVAVSEPAFNALGTSFELKGATDSRSDNSCRCGRRRPVGVLLGMRSGARPKLEGQWYCRKQCLREALSERARRDFSDESKTGSRVRHRVPLGLMLQARGVVTAEQLQVALHVQAESGCRLGDVLRNHFGVAEERITGAIAAQWGLPVLHLPVPSAMPAQNIAPARLFQSSGAFPVERTATSLLLACAEGPDPGLALALERMYPLRVEFGLVSSSVLEMWRASHQENAASVRGMRVADRDALAGEAADLLYRLQPVDSRIVRINGMWWVRLWLEEAARQQHAENAGNDVMDVLFSLP